MLPALTLHRDVGPAARLGLARFPFSARVLALGAIACGSLGCPDVDDGPCGGDGALAIALRPNHGDPSPLDDGAVLPIFPPPQGGVFTELDVELFGLRDGELQELRIRVDRDDGANLSTQTYLGSGLPVLCRPDGALSVQGLPVGFDLTYTLDDLDGDAATFTVDVITADETSTERWAITLRSVEY